MRPRGGLGWLVISMLLLALVVDPGVAQAKKKKKKGKGKNAAVPALTKDGRPNVQAAGAIVVDLDTGEELYAKKPDEVRAIASTGKIFVALVVRQRGLDLNGETVIIEEDQKLAKGGAKSRLLVGRRFKNHDLLRAMLIASDNRACTALGRAVGLTPEQLIAEMNKVAHKLGLARTKFTDPSGLRGNESTPREMTVALGKALEDPVLAAILATESVTVTATDSGEPLAGEGAKKKKGKKSVYSVTYNNTNDSLRAKRYPVLGGKTGYTDKARYCLVIAATIGGRRVAMAFLGAEGDLTRFADFRRVGDWMAGGGVPPRPEKAASVGALADSPPPAVTPRLSP